MDGDANGTYSKDSVEVEAGGFTGGSHWYRGETSIDKTIEIKKETAKTMKNNSGRLSLRKRLGLEIALKIRNNLRELHPLRQLFWECTLQCNLACKHCGSDCRKMSEQKDMPAADFLQVVDLITPHVNPTRLISS